MQQSSKIYDIFVNNTINVGNAVLSTIKMHGKLTRFLIGKHSWFLMQKSYLKSMMANKARAGNKGKRCIYRKNMHREQKNNVAKK